MHQPIKTYLVILILPFIVSLQHAHAAAKITIVNSNAQCSGFNDPTPVSASGGNYGMTIGQQRLNAFQYAANLLAQHLVTNATIRVDAQMNALGGSQYSAVLGQAGPMSVVRDFTGAPYSNTYYPVALAEALFGGEINGDSDIVTEFNSDLDTKAVLGDSGWFYGLNQTGGANIDYVTVVMHELLHGLGFLSLVNSNGQKFNNLNDTYLLHLEGHAYSPSSLSEMSNSQRANAMLDTGNLHWTGSRLVANSGSLYGGVDTSDHVFMYAPAEYNSGSSASHFSTMVSPNEGMEPFYTGPKHDPGLAIHLLHDIGWNTRIGSGSADLHLALSDSGQNGLGDNNTYTLTVSNNGNAAAVETVMTYMIPYGHDYVSSSTTSGDCFYSNRILTCRLGDINKMTNTTVNITARMKAAGEHIHAAIVSSASKESNANDNRIHKSTDVSGSSDVLIKLASDSTEYTQGSNYHYTSYVSNQGPSAATNLVVNFTLPNGLSFIGNGPSGCCVASGNDVKCYVAELDSQQTSDISFIVNTNSVGSFTSDITVSQNQLDSNPSNNNASLRINIKEEDECFIATAAFGSLMEKEVIWLRKFRDSYLMSTRQGKRLVELYYQLSPPVAEIIRQNEILRALMRGSLGPLVAFSRWLIQK